MENSMNIIRNKNELISSLTLGLQPDAENTEDMITRNTPYEGISACLMVFDATPEGNYSVRHGIRRLLDMEGITPEDAWEKAMKNIQKDTRVMSMSKALTGEENPDDELFVITNAEKANGASCILNEDVVRKFAQMHGTHRIAVIPSSRHEMLIVPHPYHICESIDELSKLVKQVNESTVDPEDRLTDRAYTLYVQW